MRHASDSYTIARQAYLTKLESRIPKEHVDNLTTLIELAVNNGTFNTVYTGIHGDETYEDRAVCPPVITWLRELGYSTTLDFDEKTNLYSIHIFWTAPRETSN